jgi:uncharacterized membrane protein
VPTRNGLTQGLIGGIAAGFGYGVGVLAGNVWDAFAGREARPARRRSWLIFLGVAVAAYVTVTAIGRYPDPDAVRLVHADRPLPDDILARVTALA